ncbi:MAG TPA: hypothetical protein VJV77_00185 [Casimicrobiaceae bacterium]|nr:hypothetical protein [Casimicrobiaceae bacterium]
MSSTKLRSVLGSMVVGVGLMTSAFTADSAVFRGSWDPSFGDPYDGMGYRGFADFFVPDACLDGDPISGVWVDNNDACSDGGMSLLAATVDLFRYDLDPNGPTVSTVVFAPPAIDVVTGVFIEFDPHTGRNEVTGADTSIFGPQTGNLSPIYSGNLWLQFVSNRQPIFSDFVALDVLPSQAFLYACDNFTGETRICESPQVVTENPGVVSFQRVPEPGSLTLIFGALAAGWAARRSTRKG